MDGGVACRQVGCLSAVTVCILLDGRDIPCLAPVEAYVSTLVWVEGICSQTGRQWWPHCEMSLIAVVVLRWTYMKS